MDTFQQKNNLIINTLITNTLISQLLIPSNETKHIGKVFVSRSKISKKYQRNSLTLRRRAEQGKIEHIIIHIGRYMYNIYQVKQMLGKEGKKRGRSSAMPECPKPSKKNNCRGRCKTSRTNTQNMKLSKRLAMASTFKEWGSKSSRSWFVKEWSPKWSSYKETDSVDLNITSWSTSTNSFTRNCWFTVKKKTMNRSSQKKNSDKTCLPSSKSSMQETMDVVLQRTNEEELKKEQEAAKKRLMT